jgi:hypothetical protein
MVKKGKIITEDREIRQILDHTKTIAVLGLSPKPDRDSHRVARYMQEHGYRILPVRPGQTEILGEKVYKSLDDIDLAVDIVDAFRSSDQIMGHVPEVIRLKPRVFWMQLGIWNSEAAAQLTDAGIDVVMDRCIKVDHGRLISKRVIV